MGFYLSLIVSSKPLLIEWGWALNNVANLTEPCSNHRTVNQNVATPQPARLSSVPDGRCYACGREISLDLPQPL